jgi:hypothetical protein
MARHSADAGDDSSARHLTLVHVARGELADLEERRTRIEQPLNPVAGQELAARDVPFAMFLGSAPCCSGNIVTQFAGERAVVLRSLSELSAFRSDFALDARCAHATSLSVSRKAVPLA